MRVANTDGDIVEHLSYFPYGETWVQEKDSLPINYGFTAKELDEETGYYYFGARYYDPRVSTWVSTDPALGQFIPTGKQLEKITPPSQLSKPTDKADEQFEPFSELPGMGGVYKSANLAVYSYVSHNPVKLVDPDGRAPVPGYNYAGPGNNSRDFSAPALTYVDQLAKTHDKEYGPLGFSGGFGNIGSIMNSARQILADGKMMLGVGVGLLTGSLFIDNYSGKFDDARSKSGMYGSSKFLNSVRGIGSDMLVGVAAIGLFSAQSAVNVLNIASFNTLGVAAQTIRNILKYEPKNEPQ